MDVRVPVDKRRGIPATQQSSIVTDPTSVSAQASQLSPRQQAMLRLLGEGLSLSESAARLEISRSTANSHRARLMERLELNNRDEVIAFAKQWAASCNEDQDGGRDVPPESVSELDDAEEPRANGRRIYDGPEPAFGGKHDIGSDRSSQPVTAPQTDRHSPSARFAGSLP